MDFSNKVCVVTGGGSGIGYATAKKYAESNATVFLIGRNAHRLESAAQTLRTETNASVTAVPGDLSRSDEIERVVSLIEQQAGAIHVLANCAGKSVSAMMLDMSEEDWDSVMNINLKSVWLLSRRIAKNMISHHVQHGKIVSVSSISAKTGEFGNGVYSVSKTALGCLTQVLALELAQYDISVTAVCPGYVDTEMLRDVFRKRGPLEGMTAEEYQNHLVSQVPLGRMAQPEEIGGFIRYLSSDDASYITGVSLTMAGGKMLL